MHSRRSSRQFGRLWQACLILILATFSGTARAEWHRSSSSHFVVYANTSERDIRRISEKLEKFHAAVALVTSTKTPPPSPSSRVTVYVVKDEEQVRKLKGGDNRFVAGFYIPRASGSIAIVPQINAGSGPTDFSLTVLLHEYSHHFLISASGFPMPRWYSEGAAEYFASARFKDDGTVEVGLPAMHRAGELFFAKDVHVSDLLDPAAYEARKSKEYDAYYGKSWLLYHYLVNNPERKGQMKTYLTELVKGKSLRDAALTAFGDFKKLEKDLDRYMLSRNMMLLRLPAEWIVIDPITVTKLDAAEAAILPLVIRSQRGVDEKLATPLLAEVRAVAARFPQHPAVLSALAEAEHDAGNFAAAIAAADAALAIDKTQVNAHVQKGYALFALAEKSGEDADFTKARRAFVALNTIENDHPVPLIYYYTTYLRQGKPPQLAVDGLTYASALAPYDLGLRMTLAMQQIKDRKLLAARASLSTIAANPHPDSLSKRARKVLDRLDKEPEWDGSGLVEEVEEKADAEAEAK